MDNQTLTPAPIIDASNCPTRMVFDDASRNLHTAVNNARRAFVRDGKIAYIWRPSSALRDQFRDEACGHIYRPMAAQLIDWSNTNPGARKPRSYNLGNSLGLRDMVAETKIASLIAHYRLEQIEQASRIFTPYLRAREASLVDGLGNDISPANMRKDGYGCYPCNKYPIHFDGSYNMLDRHDLPQRNKIDLRVVCVDQIGTSHGTRLYDLTADEVGGKDSHDGYGFKQNLTEGKPYMLSQQGDILIIEAGFRPMKHAFVHAASPVKPENIYSPNIENIRMLRTYDFSMRLNPNDMSAQQKLWQSYEP